jgi:hypothetical protein
MGLEGRTYTATPSGSDRVNVIVPEELPRAGEGL